jgi:hypothetical protein
MYITDRTRPTGHNHDGKADGGSSGGRGMPIRQFLRGGVFDPDIISVMSTAFHHVCKALEAVSDRSDVTKEMIATRIIQLAQHGETDPNVLRERVLSEFGLPRLREEP